MDDLVFARELSREGILVFPGTVFGRSRYFRIAFCVKKETIENPWMGSGRSIIFIPILPKE